MFQFVGGGLESSNCVPLVSEYTDCTDDNQCSGCSRCSCTAEGKWNCIISHKCPDEHISDYKTFDYKNLEDDDIDQALIQLERELEKKETKDQPDSSVPLVLVPDKLEDVLLEEKEVNMEEQILALMRSKRSVNDTVQGGDKDNDTITFHHAVDEINEDTLKNQNSSGTIAAQKVDMLPQISRRTSVLNNPTSNSVKIEYAKPREDIHRDDNKVDTPAIHDDKEDLIIHSNIYNSMGNQSQEGKDKELSKILVNELKGGFTETIGDKTAPVISNITFTPENDTLTAMAFIAGNLLNKLWQMEKDTSDDHIDTEILIQEKNSDLLELFKEPLNMRQELFLKNALEQLSTALNHNENVENISLCKKVEEVKTLIFGKKEDKRIRGGWRVNSEDKTNCNKSNQGNEVNQNTATVEALKKINNVLDLIKKYEIVKNSLSNMKYEKVHDNSLFNLDKAITNDEKLSLDLYGHTLETITKLLLPNKSNKMIVKSIKNCNLFSSEKDLRNKLSGIKLGDMNLTTKDRIVLDYLAHIQSNPNCLLKKQNDKISRPSIEGNILLNLSEFFKIKSLSDLVKLVEEEKPPVPVFRTQDFTTQKSVKEQTTQSIKKDSSIKFQETKEKLKGHLQFILEDLIALQKVEGKGTTGKDIQIMKALPCIYTILNAGKKEIKTPNIYETTTTPVDVSPPGKIQEIFSNLRKELKLAQTRRTSNFSGPRPKSAVVWERVIKNADGKQKLKTRRLLGKAPKTIEELKEIMDKIEMSSGSNMYKNIAYLNEVPPTERLLLLKTLNAETLRYITILEKIYTLPAMSDLPKESVKELNEFFDNVAMNVNLNKRVLQSLSISNKINNIYFGTDTNKQIKNKELKLERPSVHAQTAYDTKLSRDQIINQLIKNRILLFVQTKEATGEIQYDINYDIAKKILLHLEVGNFELARELYKVFASLKQRDHTKVKNKNNGHAREQTNLHLKYNRRQQQVEPLIKFEEPKTVNKALLNQDQLIKQLMNLRNLV